jgi:hypothetical protein
MTEIIVAMRDGAVFRVKGDRWTEPPLQPSPIPGVLKADRELDSQTAYDLRREVLRIAQNNEPVALGTGLSYTPITEPLFTEVYAGNRKVASFNPIEVRAVYFEDCAEREDE